MDFKVETKQKENIVKYDKQDIDIVYEFSKLVKKELGTMLKAIVLFGSSARKHPASVKTNDVDILLVIDDVTIKLTPELIQTYRVIVEKIVLKVSRKLHITTLRFTNFWEYVRAGDPIAINILRDGVAILDTGFFDPLQMLLVQGRIRPSAESIHNYMLLAPQTLFNSQTHLMQATLDLYWAVIDSAHAALMSINETPPSPSHVSDMLSEKLVKPGLLHKKFPIIAKRFFDLYKGITHGEINQISGAHYDTYYREASEFVAEMKRFVSTK